jgi:hypothetical protein
MVIIKDLKRGNIMPIVNDLNNYAKEELEYFGVRRQNEENAAIEKAVFNKKFDLNYDFNGFFVIIPIIVIGLIPVAKILIREAITSSVNHTPFTLSTVQILIISILSIAIFFAIALLICLKLKKCPSVQTSYLYYKDEPYTTKKLHQRLIITYSPKYALYQKTIRDKQVERAQKMLDSGSTKKNRKNPNDPARFIGKIAVTKDGEAADIKQYLDENKIAEEAQYDGLYAVCTDLLDDDVSDILKVSEDRWQIEECFRIMKTDFSTRPVYLQDENRIKAHFLICFLSLTLYRYLEKKMNLQYTCEELLDTLKAMNFAEIQEQGFIPLYKREKITDDLHEACGFRTDYQFITKSKMRTIQKESKGKD